MKASRIIRWTAVAFVVLIVAIAILINNSSFQQWTLHRLEQVVSIGGVQFSARHIQYDPYRLKATLDDVVYAAAGMSLRATRVRFDLPWNVFSSATKEITNLEVDNLEIKLTSPETAVPEPTGEPTPLPKLRFDRLLVRHGSLAYRNQSMQFQIPEFSLDVTEGRGTL